VGAFLIAEMALVHTGLHSILISDLFGILVLSRRIPSLWEWSRLRHFPDVAGESADGGRNVMSDSVNHAEQLHLATGALAGIAALL